MRMQSGGVLIYIIVCSLFSESTGLLRNCVSESEWNEDTSGTPRCELVLPSEPNIRVRCYGSKDDTEISVNRLPPDQQTEQNIPIIMCNASYPIDVDQDGFKFKSQPNIFFFRHLKENLTGTHDEKIHSIVIPLFSNIWSPRWFIFRSVSDSKLRTKFYFYYPGGNDRSLPFDWPNEKLFPTVVEPEERFAVLPCQVTHRSDVITLRKNKCATGEDFLLETNNHTVSFEPKDGFILDTWAKVEDSIYGVYTCVAQNPRKSKADLETLQVTLRRPKEFTVDPNEMNMYFFSGDRIELNCKSSKPLKMSGSFNDRRIQQQNFTYTQNPSYRSIYSAKFVYEGLRTADYGEVTCGMDGGPGHTWSFHTLDLLHNRHLQFFNNGTSVKCTSKLSTYITIFNAECYNEAHCRSRRQAIEAFGSGQCDLRLTKVVQCAQNCAPRDRRIHDKCLSIAQSRRSGVYKCETEDLAQRISYLIGYDGKIHTNVRDLRNVPIEAIIQISNPSGVVYINANHTFYCQASSYISNGEFHWLLRSPNGTEFKPKIMEVEGYHDFVTGNDSTWAANIVFTEAMEGLLVICLVPVWNTRDDWLSNYVTIDVVRPTLPTIEESDSMEQLYYIGDKNKFLPCNAKGQPPPNVRWYKDSVPVHVNMTDKGGKDLIFREITDDVSGTYACVASNPGGNTTRNFWVTVEPKPNVTLYIVAAVFLFAVFAVSVMVLYWKLMKAKRRIRNLTDEEVNEFLHGNEEAAKAAKEPHEIIMYLPFNTEYEISKDRLEFDEHDILGSGAYGVVIKGKLLGHPNEVAIKTLKPHSTLSYFKALLSELKIMIYLGKHENVVQLIGAYTGRIKERVLYMVVELSPYGNLEDYLRNQAKTFQNQIRNDQICIPTGAFTRFYANFTPSAMDNPLYINVLCTSDLVSMSHQIAEGMHHLATKKVIHADLACRNVLLYKNGVVKITDFGLSRQLYAYTSYMKKEQEPLPWRSMAIESLREMNFSSQSDSWAYGVTLWELFSLGAVPYPGLAWSTDFVDKLVHGLRLSKPAYATNEIYEIMLQCWHTDPSDRPTFDELREVFCAMRNAVEKLTD